MKPLNRRQFIKSSLAASAAVIAPFNILPAGASPNSKLNVGCIGVGGMQGFSDVNSVRSENIYAMCDVDDRFMKRAAEHFPAAQKYRDFRQMFDKEAKNLDAVTITIPDHMHATVALWAMERGIHVYLQKPLTQTVWEARLMKNAAKKFNVVSQMGNQGYSSDGIRRACEAVWRGDVGDITEIHSRNGGGFARDITAWPREEKTRKRKRRAPAWIDWKMWAGRAEEHAFSTRIHPSNWRGFQAYGTQMIGDWGVHQLGFANWALQLHAPASVECTAVEGVNPVSYPHYACKIEFPERPNQYVPAGKMPPVTLYWYEGNMAEKFHPSTHLPKEEIKNFSSVYYGTKGMMGTDGYCGYYRLIPKTKMADFQEPAPVLDRSPGHFQQWIQACKGEGSTCSNFTVAAPYTEWLLLGTISWRFPGEKLLWDHKNMRFTNNKKANEYVKPNFRKGWKLDQSTVKAIMALDEQV